MGATLPVVFVLALFLPSAAMAQPPNGAAILQSCRQNDSVKSDQCTSFINGLLDGMTASEAARSLGAPICLPDRITTDQLRSALVGWLYSHPQTWMAPGPAAVGVALQDLYPCNKR